jgi:c-di-GMP-binding flagellar brake protein YcgR
VKGRLGAMERLPLEIGSPIFIQSLENKSVKARSTVIGARHGDFIIIENPVVHFSDRLFSKLSGSISCHYLHEGDLYEFMSTIRYYGKEDFAVIEYPPEFRLSQLRKHHRIYVNIEAMLRVPRERESFKGILTDISSGGCQVNVSTILFLTKGTECFLSFTLPDNTLIDSIKSIIRNIKIDKRNNSTEVGFEFFQDQEQLQSITRFCRFCMFFEV